MCLSAGRTGAGITMRSKQSGPASATRVGWCEAALGGKHAQAEGHVLVALADERSGERGEVHRQLLHQLCQGL